MVINFDNERPIYLQLVEEITKSIISGNLKPGERLLSVRDMAIMYKVNPNTMQKALTELEDNKLIYTERTNGKFVTTDEKLIKKYKDNYAKELSNNYFNNMKSIGFTKEETIKYIKGE